VTILPTVGKGKPGGITEGRRGAEDQFTQQRKGSETLGSQPILEKEITDLAGRDLIGFEKDRVQAPGIDPLDKDGMVRGEAEVGEASDLSGKEAIGKLEELDHPLKIFLGVAGGEVKDPALFRPLDP
jgi:hypothetical protein